MIKKILIVLIVLIIVSLLVVVTYRYQILQYSAESVIRSVLPNYVEVGTVRFEFVNHMLVLGDFRIVNPPDFSNKYLLDIKEVRCGYGMKGKSFLNGIRINNPTFKKPVLYIERISDGRTNVMEMQAFMDKSTPDAYKKNPADGTKKKSYNLLSKEVLASTFLGDKRASDVMQIPDQFIVESGKIIFIDRLNPAKTHMITIEDINGSLGMKLDESYSNVISVSSVGKGMVNGKKDEILSWTISFDPATPKLTMSNRFVVTNIEIKPFEPYYDKYSPLVFNSGRFSGTLVFDFDNGNIGSTNEVRLSDLRFYVKTGQENGRFWEATVPDLIKYFTSSSGDVIFDFKIKGEMSNPKFYLGPISKQAMTAYTIDKISDAVQQFSNQQAQPASGGPKTNAEKIKQYIDIFKDIANKK